MDDFERIAEEQGWNLKTKYMLLKRFIAELDEKADGSIGFELAWFASEIQDEENVEDE